MTIRVEKGIKVPQLPKHNRYPFKDMTVGDSFMVSYNEMPAGGAQNVRTAAYHTGKINGTKFTVRRVDGGVRVWRIA